ncbi:DExD/H-box ATP-dependent RNA helicase dhh1 [Epichloe bromicola]
MPIKMPIKMPVKMPVLGPGRLLDLAGVCIIMKTCRSIAANVTYESNRCKTEERDTKIQGEGQSVAKETSRAS